MTNQPNSNTSNGNPNVDSNNLIKREGEFEDSNLVAKKFKASAFSADNAEKEGTSMLELSSSGQEDPRLDNLEGGRNNSQGGSENGCSGDKQRASELGFQIDADAAEDKGLRQTMEDAWVVLLDASLNFPGKLRCAHFAIYDGHGGRLAAEYAQKHLHENVLTAGLPLGCQSCQKGHP